MISRLLIISSLFALVSTFTFSPACYFFRTNSQLRMSSEAAAAETSVSFDPKEAVKLFGRLAEKYILLDESGGMCCYSACKDCEFRLPDGGYRMADQSASRPKWIPAYDDRNFEASGKQHTSKWSTDIFKDGALAVTKEVFVQALVNMAYAPPLGGPYVGASAAAVEDTTPAEYLFDLLAGEKEKLTKHRMQTRIKELASGAEGMTWATFSEHMTQ
jgi:hypothetical protein